MARRHDTEWISPAEAASRLGVSLSTVWRLIRRGRLDSTRMGGRRRIRAAVLDALESGCIPRGIDDLPLFTMDHPMWKLVGAFRGGPRDLSSNKYRYLTT